LTMATSNYVVGELIDHFGYSPRVVTASVGGFFLLPGLVWFVTQKWWDVSEARSSARATLDADALPDGRASDTP
jgi:hypothetical protein